MLVEKMVPGVGLEDLALYDNILRSRITKVSTRLEIFPCTEFISWIPPRVDTSGMIMNNMEDEGFASFMLAFLEKTYILPK